MKQNPTSVKKLSDVASIEQGHLFRKGIRNLPMGHIFLIQPQNVTPVKRVVLDELHKVRESDVKRSSIVGPGDVIIKTKTSVPLSFMIMDPNAKYAVTDHFMIIRINDNSVDPKYLNWYLNSNRTRSYLQRMMSGTSVPFLRKTTLMDMDIPVPDLKIQMRIFELDDLLIRETDLTHKVLELKKELSEQISYKSIKGE